MWRVWKGGAEAHAAGLDDALPVVVDGLVSLPRLATVRVQEDRARAGSCQRTLCLQRVNCAASHVDRAQAAQRLGTILHFSVDEGAGHADLVVRFVHGRPLQRDVFGWAHAGAEGKLQHVSLFIALARFQDEFHHIDIEWVGLELADALVARQQLAQFDAVEGIGLQVKNTAQLFTLFALPTWYWLEDVLRSPNPVTRLDCRKTRSIASNRTKKRA